MQHKYVEDKNILVFYCINFVLTSIKQTILRQERSLRKTTCYHCLVHIFTHVWYTRVINFYQSKFCLVNFNQVLSPVLVPIPNYYTKLRHRPL